MNAVEIEPAIRNLELMLGPECMRRDWVPSDSATIQEPGSEPEFILERYVISPDGTARVERPGAKSK